MKLSQFKFKLPEDQIALYPHSLYREFENDKGEKETFRITRRDECRLMVLHKKSQTIDMYKKDADGNPIEGEYLDFRNVLDYFDEHDTFIFNDTKVFPARLYGTKEKTDAKIEVFLLRELNEEMRLWDVLVEPARKIRIGNKLFFDESGTMVAEVIDNTTSRGRTLRLRLSARRVQARIVFTGRGSAATLYHRPSRESSCYRGRLRRLPVYLRQERRCRYCSCYRLALLARADEAHGNQGS